MMDVTALLDSYAALLDAVDSVADPHASTIGAAPAGEWNADQVLAHIALVDAATIAAASSVGSGVNTTYDNRNSLDHSTLERVIALSGGSAGLRERVRHQGDALCTLGSQVLSEAELDTLVPTLLLSANTVLVDQPLPLRTIFAGLANDHLPRHTQQILALLPSAEA